jgi:hypothetical protein
VARPSPGHKARKPRSVNSFTRSWRTQLARQQQARRATRKHADWRARRDFQHWLAAVEHASAKLPADNRRGPAPNRTRHRLRNEATEVLTAAARHIDIPFFEYGSWHPSGPTPWVGRPAVTTEAKVDAFGRVLSSNLAAVSFLHAHQQNNEWARCHHGAHCRQAQHFVFGLHGGESTRKHAHGRPILWRHLDKEPRGCPTPRRCEVSNLFCCDLCGRWETVAHPSPDTTRTPQWRQATQTFWQALGSNFGT